MQRGRQSPGLPGCLGSTPVNAQLVPSSELMSLFWEKKILRQPGVEPGSTAWKAAMLTVIPLTLTVDAGAHAGGPLQNILPANGLLHLSQGVLALGI